MRGQASVCDVVCWLDVQRNAERMCQESGFVREKSSCFWKDWQVYRDKEERADAQEKQAKSRSRASRSFSRCCKELKLAGEGQGTGLWSGIVLCLGAEPVPRVGERWGSQQPVKLVQVPAQSRKQTWGCRDSCWLQCTGKAAQQSLALAQKSAAGTQMRPSVCSILLSWPEGLKWWRIFL